MISCSSLLACSHAHSQAKLFLHPLLLRPEISQAPRPRESRLLLDVRSAQLAFVSQHGALHADRTRQKLYV